MAFLPTIVKALLFCRNSYEGFIIIFRTALNSNNILNTNKHLLSKSSFLKGLQCSKLLYLYKYHYNWKDAITADEQAKFSNGTNVGVLAQQLFPGGIDASPKNYKNFQPSITLTQKLIKEGTEVIYEAAFNHKQVLAAMDILVKKNNAWCAYEVKSATRISAVNIQDAALQYYVISQSGIELEDISIITINNQYVRDSHLDIHKLFSIQSVLKEALAMQDIIHNKIIELKEVIDLPFIPVKNIGEHCFSPYKCNFMGHCWKHIPKNSVFEIAGLKREAQFTMFNSGIKQISDIADDMPLKHAQQVQIKSVKQQQPIIDTEGIKQFLASVKYPIYFMDFESSMPAVPLLANTRPYENIPIQYSLHFKHTAKSKPVHFEFLAHAGGDPRREFIECLLRDTEKEGDILVYDRTFEAKILQSLIHLFPEHTEKLKNRISRIKDLMEPFEKKYYYSSEMKGSHSLKSILPALVPGLNYDKLKINSGAMAMTAFHSLHEVRDLFHIAETREALLEYCKMDTYAMVKIFEKLEDVVLTNS